MGTASRSTSTCSPARRAPSISLPRSPTPPCAGSSWATAVPTTNGRPRSEIAPHGPASPAKALPAGASGFTDLADAQPPDEPGEPTPTLTAAHGEELAASPAVSGGAGSGVLQVVSDFPEFAHRDADAAAR